MRKISLDEDMSIGAVTQAEYEQGREERLMPEDIAERSKYKLRLLGLKAISGKYALDFLCQINKIRQLEYEAHELSLTIFDRDAKSVGDASWELGLNGLIRILRPDSTSAPDSEAGYMLDAMDEWDRGLLAITNQLEITHALNLPQSVPVVA